MSIKVYGASDDLVEIEGDIQEEFGVYGDGVHKLTFNDGTVLRVQYRNGVWKVTVIEKGASEIKWVYTADDDSEDRSEGYTDIVELTGAAITSVGIVENWKEGEHE